MVQVLEIVLDGVDAIHNLAQYTLVIIVIIHFFLLLYLLMILNVSKEKKIKEQVNGLNILYS